MLRDRFAIVSVSDKDGIVEFCKGLNFLGYRIISTSGTYSFLKNEGIDVIEISSITGFPEILDGRVKTLHPKIHGGILYKNLDTHFKQLESHGLPNIELVVVNLYPFEQTVDEKADLDVIVENIDIGGPTLIRAAAKNYERVIVIVDKCDYQEVLEKLSKGGNTLEFRQYLAAKAFNYIAYYDAVIARFFNELVKDKFSDYMSIGVKKLCDLRYGENPHQKASSYLLPNYSGNSILRSEVLWGKELSFNNVLDANVALEMISEFSEDNFCCIIKHNIPCGAAIGESLVDAYEKALAGDPVSAFGGIVGFSKGVDKEVAEKIVKNFYEVVVAPYYSVEALDILKTKKNLRVIKVGDIQKSRNDLEIKSVLGGFLVQERDEIEFNISKCKVVTDREPSDREKRDLSFAWRIVKFVKSNAIVIAKDGMTIGICGGQTSRVEAVRIALSRAKEFGFSSEGAVCASDAFFPFKDSVEILASEKISSIIQPGGSVRDQESIDVANQNNISMIFTGIRHFRH